MQTDITDKFRELNQWFSQPLGSLVASAITEQLTPYLEKLHGENLVQIGVESQAQWLHVHKSLRTFLVTPDLTAKGNHLIASAEHLPFASNSISLVFLPLTLELYTDINPLLYEIDRVLTGDGMLLVCSINPISWWGLAKLCDKQDVFPVPHPHLRTSMLLRSMVNSMSYEVVLIKSFFYRIPAVSATTLANMVFLEHMGKILWPYPGGIYMLMARKSEAQLLAIKPLWHFRHYVIGKEFAEPGLPNV